MLQQLQQLQQQQGNSNIGLSGPRTSVSAPHRQLCSPCCLSLNSQSPAAAATKLKRCCGRPNRSVGKQDARKAQHGNHPLFSFFLLDRKEIDILPKQFGCRLSRNIVQPRSPGLQARRQGLTSGEHEPAARRLLFLYLFMPNVSFNAAFFFPPPPLFFPQW